MKRFFATSNLVKHYVRRGLRVAGYEIHAANELRTSPTMEGALIRATLRRLHIETVIDVGASTGIWTLLAMNYFPRAQYMLIEAQTVHESSLQALTREKDNVRYVLSAAGEKVGRIFFDDSNPFSGRASPYPLTGGDIEVPVTTIDVVVDQYQLPPPYCLKLDTHGYEVPILNGAEETLRQASLVVVECYNFRLPDALLLHEMCAFMDGLGFRCIDLVDQLYRPGDQAFWQADLFFEPKVHDVFARTTYQDH
jgi:FkbM family methyltransferase